MLPHLGPRLCYFMNKEIELEKGNSWFKSTRLGIGREGIKNQGSLALKFLFSASCCCPSWELGDLNSSPSSTTSYLSLDLSFPICKLGMAVPVWWSCENLEYSVCDYLGLRKCDQPLHLHIPNHRDSVPPKVTLSTSGPLWPPEHLPFLTLSPIMSPHSISR